MKIVKITNNGFSVMKNIATRRTLLDLLDEPFNKQYNAFTSLILFIPYVLLMLLVPSNFYVYVITLAVVRGLITYNLKPDKLLKQMHEDCSSYIKFDLTSLTDASVLVTRLSKDVYMSVIKKYNRKINAVIFLDVFLILLFPLLVKEFKGPDFIFTIGYLGIVLLLYIPVSIYISIIKKRKLFYAKAIDMYCQVYLKYTDLVISNKSL